MDYISSKQQIFYYTMIETFLRQKRLFQQSRIGRQSQNSQLNATSLTRFSQNRFIKRKEPKRFNTQKLKSFPAVQESQFSDYHSFVPKILIKPHTKKTNKFFRKSVGDQLEQSKRKTFRINVFTDGNSYFSENNRNPLKSISPSVRSVSQFITSSQNIQIKIKKPAGYQFAVQGTKKSLIQPFFTPQGKGNTTLCGFRANRKVSLKGSIRQYKKKQYLVKQNQKRSKAFRGDKDMFDFEVIGRCRTFQEQCNPWQNQPINDSTSFEFV